MRSAPLDQRRVDDLLAKPGYESFFQFCRRQACIIEQYPVRRDERLFLYLDRLPDQRGNKQEATKNDEGKQRYLRSSKFVALMHTGILAPFARSTGLYSRNLADS